MLLGSTIQSTTLGELFSEPIATRSSVNEALNRKPTVLLSVLHTSDSEIEVWIQIPKQRKYVEITTIRFELFKLIAIKGNAHKCAGCGGKLKYGLDSLLVHDLDKSICIRQKEKDH